MEPDQDRPAGPNAPWLIVISASAGGIPAISKILAALPGDLPAAVVIVLHRLPKAESYLERSARGATAGP